MDFARRAGTLMAGSLVAQAVNILLYPVITWLYVPADFGVFSMALAVVMVINPIATLQYSNAIMLPQDDETASDLFRLAERCTLAVAALLFLAAGLVALFPDNPLFTLPDPWRAFLWFIPLGVLLEGLNLNHLTYAIRKKGFSTIAAGRVAQAVADRGLAIGLGFASLGAWGLFIGRWAAPLIPIAMLRRKAVAPDMGRAQAPKGRLLELARRYKDFPLFTTWSLIFTNLSQEAPVLLLGLLYDPAAAGLLALAARVVRVPLTTVGDAIHKVYMQQAAEMMDNPGLLKEKTLLLAKVLCLGMSPLLLVLGILGRPLFGAVFGQAWGTAGLYCQYLAVYFFTLLLYRPLSVHFSLMERQRLMFGVTIGLLAARVGSLLAVHLAGGSVDTAVGVLGAVSGLAMLATVLVLLRTIGITFAEAGRLAARIAILAAPLAVCLSALAASGLHPWVLVSAAAVLTAAQAALAVFVDKELRRLLSRVLGARRDPIR